MALSASVAMAIGSVLPPHDQRCVILHGAEPGVPLCPAKRFRMLHFVMPCPVVMRGHAVAPGVDSMFERLCAKGLLCAVPS